MTDYSVILQLFKASSILSGLGMCCPLDSSYDKFREHLFNAHMEILKAQDSLPLKGA